jgi:hypothetical protein
MASRRIAVDKGFALVIALALFAFVGTYALAEREENNWREDRAEVLDGNVDKVGTGQELDEYPERPLIVRQSTPFAIGAALVVAVVGSVIVLLSAIVARLR